VIAKFIAIEGGEGCGKTTQAARLAERLDAHLTHEPGATRIGGAIRHLLLDPSTEGLDARAEALLMAADRAQHVAEVVRPTLAAGRHVVTDRFAGSSLAYQGYGREQPVEEIEHLSRWAAAGTWPDLVVLLDVAHDVADARVGPARDRLEAEGGAFHQRVAAGFRALAAADPDLWLVVDGSGSEVEVAERIWSAVTHRWPELA
jgi:dTMP kinase